MSDDGKRVFDGHKCSFNSAFAPLAKIRAPGTVASYLTSPWSPPLSKSPERPHKRSRVGQGSPGHQPAEILRFFPAGRLADLEVGEGGEALYPSVDMQLVEK